MQEPQTNKNLRATWTMLIVASLMFQIFVALVHTGVESTPYGTYDDQGRVYRYNAPVTWGHLGMFFSNVTREGLIEHVDWYPLLCMVAHVWGFYFLWSSKVSKRDKRWFFGLQMLFFPLGWNPLTWIAVLILMVSAGSLDGEILNDGLFHPLLAQVTWFLVSAVILFHDFNKEEASERKFIARYS